MFAQPQCTLGTYTFKMIVCFTNDIEHSFRSSGYSHVYAFTLTVDSIGAFTWHVLAWAWSAPGPRRSSHAGQVPRCGISTSFSHDHNYLTLVLQRSVSSDIR